MPRTARLHYPNQYYHIFNRGFDRKDIFKDTQDYLRFLSKLELSRQKFDWIIYSYCLMPNHYHLHVRVRQNPLSQIIHSLQTSHSVYFNRRHKHFSSVFTKRYKSILIQKDAYHLSLSKYIHLNPVKSKLVDTPQKYPYSSYSEYIGKPKHEFKIIDKRAVKSLFNPSNSQELSDYRMFIEGTPTPEYSPEIAVRSIAGSDRFRSQFE